MATQIFPTTSTTLKSVEFWLLLLYSLLPAIYKLLDNQFYMLLSVPIIFYFICKNQKFIHIRSYDTPFLILLVYILLQSFFCLFWSKVNKMGLAMGFMNVFPMLGYFIAKGINFKQLSGFLLWIILIHCIIGILLYPPFGFVDDSIFYVEKTTRLFGRMESVSGSLGFGCLLIIGFILSFFTDRRFLFITAFCLLLSMQRSAWIGALFAILIYIWEKMKQGYSREVMLLLVSCLLFVGFFYFISNYLNIDLEFMISRFERIGNATSERGGQWIAGLDNFLDYPLGTGIGQTGQFAARYEEVKSSFRIVADGDYFRILSEMGIVGGLFFIMLIIRCIFHLIKMRFRAKEEVAIIALTSAGLIQMIGSNISEFYFTNFLFWMIIGYFFIVINEHNKIHCNDIHLHGNL